jgi:hypothetical protein
MRGGGSSAGNVRGERKATMGMSERPDMDETIIAGTLVT